MKDLTLLKLLDLLLIEAIIKGGIKVSKDFEARKLFIDCERSKIREV